MMDRQTTIANSARCSGVGVHSGVVVRMAIHPAGAGEGVTFVRTDKQGARIPATALGVATTQLGTNIANADGVQVATVEHFLAACSGLGLDNVVAEVDGPELPILDGSSAPFCKLIAGAGLKELPEHRRVLKIRKPVEVRDGVKFARLSPGEGTEFRVTIDFPSKAIGRQSVVFRLTPGAFQRDVAFARTFGFAHEVEKLRSMGLARGGALDNAIVVDGDTILNPGGLQVEDEFVRHKLIDVIGDLYLAGGPIEGVYEAEQPGHAINNKLLRAVFADPDAFAWV
jgi:UDP-3-O-[3-hydroxymyristoyl] N-acetylglucosamine deacetylase